MKTLLQINVFANSGSHGKIAEDIGKIVLQNGWKSYIAYGRKANKSESKLIKIGYNLTVKWHGIESRLLDNHGLSSRCSTKKLIRKIKRIKPDIIHLHNIHGYYINYKILFNYLRQNNIPVIWTLHDCWTFTGHCSHFDYIKCYKWKTQCYDCIQKTSYPTCYFLDKSERNYNLKKRLFTSIDRMILVPVSNWLGDLVKESFLNKYPVNVIHNGVDIQDFQPYESSSIRKKYNLHNKFVIIGVANVWNNQKGLEDFKKLRSILSEQVVIILVGLQQKQINELPKGIIGITKTENRKELAELYSCADVYFNPTYQDNFPTTNIEALACGTPVITYKTGGSVEAVDEQTGFIIEQGEFAKVREIIEQIKQKGREYYKKTCRIRVEENYDKDKCFKRYFDLYKTLLEENKTKNE